MIALAYTVTVLILLGCIARGAPALRPGRVILLARWAWRCHGKPVPADGEKLTTREVQVLGNLDAGRDVRSRT